MDKVTTTFVCQSNTVRDQLAPVELVFGLFELDMLAFRAIHPTMQLVQLYHNGTSVRQTSPSLI